MLYLSSDFFYTELEALAYFNHTLTFPFLHCVEKSLLEELLKILPKLHQDLLEGKTDTLKDFVLEIWRVPVKEPSSELGRKITNMMCLEAAKGVKLQCSREYGIDNTTTDVWAIILSDLDKAELKGPPTHNITVERKLAVFDKHAGKVGKCRNYKFTVKSARNDMPLYSSKQGTVDTIVRNITKLLDVRGWMWDKKQ